MNTNNQTGHKSHLLSRALAFVPISVHWALVVMSPVAREWFQKIKQNQSIRVNLRTSALRLAQLLELAETVAEVKRIQSNPLRVFAPSREPQRILSFVSLVLFVVSKAEPKSNLSF